MPTRVLIPVDGSDRSWEAFEYATELFENPRLTVLYVIDPAEGDYSLDDSDEPVEQSAEIRKQVAAPAESDFPGDPDAVSVEIATGKPAQTIIDHTSNDEVDHVVIASRGRSGVRRLLLGSVAETVLRRSSVPVTVVREAEASE
jgi:nucleotide-binding universal stress UspA family protein